MRRKKRQILLNYWLETFYPWALKTNLDESEPEPWVCPGYSSPPPRLRNTVSDFIHDPVYSEQATGQSLAIKPETLKKWRQRGRGPAYIQYGKNGIVRYSLSAIRFWQNRSHHIPVPDEDPAFNSKEAAIVLGVKIDTLKKWRRQNRGPAFFRRAGGRVVRYRLSSLMAFRLICTVTTKEIKVDTFEGLVGVSPYRNASPSLVI